MTHPRLAVVAACLVGKLSAARAGVEVTAHGGCIDTTAVREGLETVVRRTEQHGEVDLSVAEQPASNGGASVSLHVTRGRRNLLDRAFQLRPSECASAAELLSLVVDRLLTGLPIESWDEEAAALPAQPAGPIAQAPHVAAHRELVIVSAANVAVPLGGDLQLGARLDQGRAWRGGGGVVIGQSLPSSLGRGQVTATFAMASAGARHIWQDWAIGVELHGGGLRLAGRGFDANRTAWVPWVESAATLSWVGPHAEIGLIASGSPLTYHAQIANRMETTEIPRFRVGLVVSFPIWASR